MRQVNEGLKIVAAKANVSENLTTYVARHSFASACINAKVPSFLIQKQMNHKSLKTTEIYLKHFPSPEDDQIIGDAIAI